MQVIGSVLMMFAVLIPTKVWYAPGQDIPVQVKLAGSPVTLVMFDFLGKPVEGDIAVRIASDQTINLRQYWPQLNTPGTYILMAVPQGKAPKDFIGTPLVVDVRADKRRDAPPGPMVVKIVPLRYAIISTDEGDMTVAFYYDAAPHTVTNFFSLADTGFYDGLNFFRLVSGFILQGGDPKGDGTGGPGYFIDAEFNNREMREGVLAMARQTDPIERQGDMPRAESANSAGSQFFICLDYERTKQLTGRYTAFGRVVDGMDVLAKLAKTPTDSQEHPTHPLVIKGIRAVPVTADKNPYQGLLKLSSVPVSVDEPAPATAPTTAP